MYLYLFGPVVGSRLQLYGLIALEVCQILARRRGVRSSCAGGCVRRAPGTGPGPGIGGCAVRNPQLETPRLSHSLRLRLGSGSGLTVFLILFHCATTGRGVRL